MVQDYPDGFSRDVPGHTVELEAGFSLPWHQHTTLTIPAGGNSSFTINFNDPNWIYYVDMVNVSAQAYVEFYIFIEINGVIYAGTAEMGSTIVNLRMNPSIVFINGDSIKVYVYSKDSSQRNFVVHINGSKIIRPALYGHPPSASWSASAYVALPGQDILFTDESAYNPTEWDWDFDDGSPHSTEQNPVHAYAEEGSYYPILKASNQYGFDTYARASPISITSFIDLTAFTEVDPGNKITVSPFSCVFTGLVLNTASYVYKDYSIDYFDSYHVRFDASVSSITYNGYFVYVFGLANSVGALTPLSGNKVTLRFLRNFSGTYEMYLTLFNGTTILASQSHAITLDTTYYVDVYHDSGSDTVIANVYSDSSFSTLLFTLSVTHASVNTKFRYLYALSAVGNGSTYAATGVVSNYLFM